jgi:ribokinase
MDNQTPYDVLCIGSATEDVFVGLDEAFIIKVEDRREERAYLSLEYGAKVPVDDCFLDTGGGATNCAVTFARMGLRTGIVCKVGADPAGDRVAAAMAAEGIGTEHIARHARQRTGYSIVLLGFTGDRTILVYRGASSELAESDVHWDDVARAQWVYMNSLSGASAPLFAQVAEFCGAHGVKLAINPGGTQLHLGLAGMAPVLKHTAALFLNKAEAYELTGVPPDRGPEDEKQMLCLLREAGCERVIMTHGAEGSEAMDAGGHYKQPALPAQAASTVGAGDAFASACVVGLQRGYDLPQALRLGAANSAAVIQHIGAKTGILTWEKAVAAAGISQP